MTKTLANLLLFAASIAVFHGALLCDDVAGYFASSRELTDKDKAYIASNVSSLEKTELSRNKLLKREYAQLRCEYYKDPEAPDTADEAPALHVPAELCKTIADVLSELLDIKE